MSEEQDKESQTEDPTERRLQEARNKGNIPKSTELGYAATFFAVTLMLSMMGPSIAEKATSELGAFLSKVDGIPVDLTSLGGVVMSLAGLFALLVAGPLFLIMAVNVFITIMQTGFVWTTEPLKPDLSRLSLFAGIKKLFSMHALQEMLKSIVKLGLVIGVAWGVLRHDFDEAENLVLLSPNGLLEACGRMFNKFMATFLPIFGGIAALDYFFQRRRFMQQLRMTKQQVKEEMKDSEGDPFIKAKQKQIRMQRARRRMMQAVPKADVIITNPTHFAVAMQYDPQKSAAPIVVAKGADLVAKKIRELAEEHKVPLVSNPPLARALYKSVEIDQEIPAEHYKAVAEIISYVYKLKNKKWGDKK
ncbi:MAG: flagellar biosynthesis protein FlhB [Alphaproteobacteria bacterium]